MEHNMKNLAQALLKAQKNMGVALKDAKNPFFKSKYADLNSVIDASLTVLNEAGVLVLQPTVVLEGKAYVETKLIHAESGESISGFTEIVVKSATDAQQVGSGISYARRYGLQSLVVLKADDNDGETAVGRGDTKAVSGSITLPVASSIAATTAPVVATLVAKPVQAAKPPPFQINRNKAATVSNDDI
jgi:hypothetical protein